MTPPVSFSDPRLLPDFNPEFLPTCDGDAPPRLDSREPCHQYMIEFAAAYYVLNAAQALLEQAGQRGDAPAMHAAAAQRKAASDARDALEDRLALVQFHAYPAMRGERYVDLHFRLRGEIVRPRVHVRQFVAQIAFEA